MSRVILLADRVFSDGDVREGYAVVVQGDRIAEVTPKEELAFAADDTIREFGGCTLLPGLIDAHVHFGPEVQASPYARVLESTYRKLIKAVVDAGNMLAAGFTSARDVGGVRALHLRDAIAAGDIPGPSLLCSGRILTTVGGLEDHRYLQEPWVNELSDLVEVCQPGDGVRAAVRNRRREGADFVKIFATGADCVQQFSDDELQAIVLEARRLGMTTAAHAYGGAAVAACVRAGCTTIEHGSWLEESDCELMVRAGVVLLPDLAFTHRFITEGAQFGVQASDIEAERQRLDDMMRSTAMAHEFGVRVAVGTDYGLRAFARHGSINLLALYLLEDAGLSRSDVLRAATTNAAVAMGWEHLVGSIEVDRKADILVVRGNPLDNLRALEEVAMVMKSGVVVSERP